MRQSLEWWNRQATRTGGRRCPKCGGGVTSGMFIAPNREGDCGVIEKCRICGWERVVIPGYNMRPMDAMAYHEPNPNIRLPGPKRTRDEWMRIKGAKA